METNMTENTYRLTLLNKKDELRNPEGRRNIVSHAELLASFKRMKPSAVERAGFASVDDMQQQVLSDLWLMATAEIKLPGARLIIDVQTGTTFTDMRNSDCFYQ